MLAAEYALQIQPDLTAQQQRDIHDALQLASLCSKPFAPVDTTAVDLEAAGAGTGTTARAPRPDTAGRPQIYVDPDAGSDGNPGTLARPLQTLPAAVAASRTVKAGRGTSIDDAAVIQLRAGSYHLAETVVLGAADSGLTITAFRNEAVEISGGMNLAGLAWAPSAADPKVWVTKVAPESLGPAGIPALQVEGRRATLARFPNANPELDLFPAGYIADKTAWMTPEYKSFDVIQFCPVAHAHRPLPPTPSLSGPIVCSASSPSIARADWCASGGYRRCVQFGTSGTTASPATQAGRNVARASTCA